MKGRGKQRIFAPFLTLALGELEAPPGSPHAVFFPLDHARVAGKETVAPQAGIVALVYLAQGAGKPVAAGACLTAAPAAVHIDQNIKLVFV